MEKMWKFVVIAVIIGLLSPIHGAEVIEAEPSEDFTDYESKEILAGRQVFVYRSYKDVQIFHYNIPSGVVSAYFNFTANDTLACNTRNISVFLQAGSYPVINPDGAQFPPLMWTQRTKIYEVQLQSNLKPAFLMVDNPVPGDWYMIAFINDTSNRITQAGLFPSCHSWLMSEVKYKKEMSVTTIVPEIHSTQEIHLLQKVSQKQYYKFYVPVNTWTVTVLIDKCEEVDGIDCPVIFGVRGRGLPDFEDSSTSVRNCSLALDSVNNVTCELTLIPEEEAWHYILVQAITEDAQLSIAVKLSMCESASISSYHLLTKLNLSQLCPSKPKEKENHTSSDLETVDPSSVRRILFPSLPSNKQNNTAKCWKRHNLVKKTFAGNFVFEFDQVPDENGSIPLMMNISNSQPTIVSFRVEPIIDIGGTLAFELAILPFMNVSANNISLLSCLSVGVRSEVNEPGNCSGNGKLLNINTTTPASAAGAVLVPFPEPGVWYITLLPSCFLTNASESVECLEKETSVVFSISSASCIQGKCGHYGSCYQYISGGFIFSTCVCDAGYQGWGCTDNSQATPDWELLLATLLLTLSNLLFLPVVVLAIVRRHYAEAVIYAFTMFFSTFYHACDQEAYNFCLMRLSVMQFCDFYSAILSFWVTLIAMADLPHSLYSLLHMAGAVTVALGVEYNRTGLWVFVIPSASAFIVMVSSWIWHCKKSKTCYPKKKYWLFCLIPGVLLAATGLIFYTLLETVDNYPFVHSAWHATMALCITFLLPPKKKDYEHMTPEDLDPLPGCEALPEATELVPNAIHSISTLSGD